MGDGQRTTNYLGIRTSKAHHPQYKTASQNHTKSDVTKIVQTKVQEKELQPGVSAFPSDRSVDPPQLIHLIAILPIHPHDPVPIRRTRSPTVVRLHPCTDGLSRARRQLGVEVASLVVIFSPAEFGRDDILVRGEGEGRCVSAIAAVGEDSAVCECEGDSVEAVAAVERDGGQSGIRGK